MLAQLSARLRVRQAAGGGGEGGEDEGEGVPIMIDDNCEVSLITFRAFRGWELTFDIGYVVCWVTT